MTEDSIVTFTTGAAGQSGDQMAGDVVVTGGSVTSVTITTQELGIVLVMYYL